MTENMTDEQAKEILREYAANPWPISERFLDSLRNDAPDFLKESIDEITDDAFNFEIPPEYAALWIKALESRPDRQAVQDIIEHLQWYLDPANTTIASDHVLLRPGRTGT